MSILVAERVAKSFDPYDIFWDISCSVAHGDRIALVGRNGTGKTTLLRILIGLEPASSGRVHRARGLRIGYLPQGATLEGEHSLWQEMMGAFEPLRAMEARLHKLETEMADPARTEEVLETYAPLRDRFEQQGGYTYQDRAKHVLMGLGFPPEDHDMPLDHFLDILSSFEEEEHRDFLVEHYVRTQRHALTSWSLEKLLAALSAVDRRKRLVDAYNAWDSYPPERDLEAQTETCFRKVECDPTRW